MVVVVVVSVVVVAFVVAVGVVGVVALIMVAVAVVHQIVRETIWGLLAFAYYFRRSCLQYPYHVCTRCVHNILF